MRLGDTNAAARTGLPSPLRKYQRSPVEASQRPAVDGPPVTTHTPSGLNEASETVPPCPLITTRVLPVRAFQIRASPSLLAVTTLRPSGENSAERTSARCPRSVTPLSRRTTAPSMVARGSRVGSGAALPGAGRKGGCSWVTQVRTVPSSPPVASRSPGRKIAVSTWPSCPAKTARGALVSTLQVRAVPSRLAVSTKS